MNEIGKEQYRLRHLLNRPLLYLIVLIVCLIFIYPVFRMITQSLMTYEETLGQPPPIFPHFWHFDNYITAWTVSQYFPRQFLNSIILSVVPTFGVVLSSSLAGFAFARLYSPYKKPLFSVVIGTMMLPSTAMFIASFMFWHNLFGTGINAINTYLPFLLPPFFGSPFYIFLFRQFFATLPGELEEAAIIDGCGMIRIWWQVFIPISKPVFATAVVWLFCGYWNDYLTPRFFINSNELYPLSVGLLNAFRLPNEVILNQLNSVGAIIYAVPAILVYFIGQRYIVQGFVSASIKG